MDKAIKLLAAISVASGAIAAVLKEYQNLTKSENTEKKEISVVESPEKKNF